MTAEPTSTSRRLPRFSLRSLILFVLLAGSGYGLWVHWEPWVIRQRLEDHALGSDLSPDGEWVVVYEDDIAALKLWSPRTGQFGKTLKQRSSPDRDFPWLVAVFSPCHRRLVTQDGSIWEIDSGHKITTTREPEWGIGNLEFALDGQTFAFIDDKNRLCVLNLTDASIQRSPEITNTSMPANFFGPRFSLDYAPDGQSIVMLDRYTHTVFVFDARTLVRRRVLKCGQKGDSWLSEPLLSPDGRLMVLADPDSGLHLWDIEGANLPQVLKTHLFIGYFPSLGFTHDGRYLFASSLVRISVFDTRSWTICGRFSGFYIGRGARPASRSIPQMTREDAWQFLPEGQAFILFHDSDGSGVEITGSYTVAVSPRRDYILVQGPPDKDIIVYHRRRPEYWWGVAWLPEFWLTLVLGGALVWSVWRDSRMTPKELLGSVNGSDQL